MGRKPKRPRSESKDCSVTSEDMETTNSVNDNPINKSKISSNIKFLIIEAKEKNYSLNNVSVFSIKKSIDNCCGAVINAKKLTDGTLLVECKDSKQAQKLMKLPFIFGNNNINIEVNVREHGHLNTVKGIVYSNEFNDIDEKEIQEGLADQKVIAVKKLKINNQIAEKYKKTGVILTFNLFKLPETISVGYEIVYVKTYVPSPLQCFNCWKLGHMSNNCKTSRKCLNCNEDYHGENCNKESKCTNCNESTHNSREKKECEAYKKEHEIQKIKVEDKISYLQARNKYNILFPDPNKTSYSKIIQQNTISNKTCNCKCSCNNPANATNNSPSEPSTSNINIDSQLDKIDEPLSHENTLKAGITSNSQNKDNNNFKKPNSKQNNVDLNSGSDIDLSDAHNINLEKTINTFQNITEAKNSVITK